MKLSKLKYQKGNPRIIKDERFKKLKKSIEEFPKMLELRPMIYNPETMEVMGGNMRLKALRELEYKDIPDNWIKSAESLTEDERKRFIIVDNVGFGEWDYEALANEWDENELCDWGLELDIKVLEDDLTDDDIPEIQKNAITTYGDVYELNNHRVTCGDSCNVDDVKKLIGDVKSDLIFTDPPFDLEDNYSNIIIDSAKDDSHVFIMNSDKLLIENIKNNQQYFRKMFYVDFRQARLVANNQPMTRVDPIAEFVKGKTKFNNLFDGFSTLIECAKVHNNNEAVNFGFNQAKKVELPETFVLHYSDVNDIVFDFFGGSGTTLVACEKNNRICYTNEFDPLHVDIILRRFVAYMTEHSRLFEIKRNGEKIDADMFLNMD